MQKKIRPDPIIPDHEVFRKIGGGSYGEVWLARGVTGAMRAVKVVYREDFSDERTFEREFQGILKFEPISRDHPGFVNVLHVGRSEGKSPFYYYVMELGDDANSDGEINLVEYEPRTLRTDTTRANGMPLDTDFCVETGRRLAEALAELHARGLTHRDVKPSNVIFVEGNAKLADVGLVATTDQRTFVGTEGFVPPEGPGSEQADIYSLGKVLYEMVTGMDRLQFPELPEEGPPEEQRKKWIRLNRVICDICEPRLSKRVIKTGAELVSALSRLEEGKKVQKKISPLTLPVAVVLLLGALIGWSVWLEKSWGTFVIEGQPVTRFVNVKIRSKPDQAKVYDDLDGELIGVTQVSLRREVGTVLSLTFQKKGFHDRSLTVEVVDDGSQTLILTGEMDRSPPVEGDVWMGPLGVKYLPENKSHRSAYVGTTEWEIFLKEIDPKSKPRVEKIVYGELGREIVAVPEDWAEKYADWLTDRAIEEGFLQERLAEEENFKGNREFSADYGRDFPAEFLSKKARDAKVWPFQCEVRVIPYAILHMQTVPEGADVFIEGRYEGKTPLSRAVRPGVVNFSFELDGFEGYSDNPVLEDEVEKKVFKEMKRDASVVWDQSWTNSLGMIFEPLDKDLMVCIWEVRSGDFNRFVKSKMFTDSVIASPEPSWLFTIDEDPNVPVSNVTRVECEFFSEWLTNEEMVGGRLKDGNHYRLPTDAEWSRMVGLVEFEDKPSTRETEYDNAGLYPWGLGWPPTENAGNYADVVAAGGEYTPIDESILEYNDGYELLAPVGKFTSNARGLFDLGGNVHEWVSDVYKEGEDYGVLRGGGYKSYIPKHLELRHRDAVEPDQRRETYGFRVVLARERAEKISEEDENETEEDDGRDPNSL